jgi:hypothetical protein
VTMILPRRPLLLLRRRRRRLNFPAHLLLCGGGGGGLAALECLGHIADELAAFVEPIAVLEMAFERDGVHRYLTLASVGNTTPPHTLPHQLSPMC